MRILLTSPTYPPHNSGLGNAANRQAASLAQAGHEVVVATGGAERASRRDDGGIRIETFPLSGSASWLHPIRGDQAAYVAFLIQPGWDVVLLNAWQNWATDLALRHLGRIGGRKFVYSHCISTNSFFLHQPLRSLVRYLAWRSYWWRLTGWMRQLDGILFLAGSGTDSRFDDLRLAQRHGVPLEVIPNSLSPAAVNALEVPPVPLARRDRLIAVGSYEWQKGFDFVLRAYAASRARNRIPLHFYGQQPTAYLDHLATLARQLELEEGCVVFHIGISGADLMAEYCRARLFLSGSHTECQPLTLIDANAAGTPFLARITGCIAAMPGGTGVQTWQDMAAGIDALEQDAGAWQMLGEAGRRAACDIYHPSLTQKQLLAVLERAMPMGRQAEE